MYRWSLTTCPLDVSFFYAKSEFMLDLSNNYHQTLFSKCLSSSKVLIVYKMHFLLCVGAPWQFFVRFMWVFLMQKANFCWTYPLITIRFSSSKCLSSFKVPTVPRMHFLLCIGAPWQLFVRFMWVFFNAKSEFLLDSSTNYHQILLWPVSVYPAPKF